MKKMMLVVLVLAMASFAAAQVVGTYTPTQDILGAHNNGGRGCAGCHAPHTGAAGNGQTTDLTGGTNALFGQDLTPVYALNVQFGGQAATWAIQSTNTEVVRGIGMCLACHDGSTAKGAMMQGVSYEQQFGILPTSTYGTSSIPTFLGTGAAAYTNDHPVGPEALLVKSAHTPVTVTVDTAAKKVTAIAPKTQAYTDFVASYGAPALAGTPWAWGVAPAEDGSQDGYLLCTTCHNQHVMNVYSAPMVTNWSTGTSAPKIAGSPTGTFKTYFFVNGAYNVDPINSTGNTLVNKAPTTSQFCRQCHFSEANEYFGLKLETAY